MKCYGSTAVSKTASSGSTPGTPATRSQRGFMVIVVQWKRREDVALERGVRFSSITPRAHGEIGTLAGQRPVLACKFESCCAHLAVPTSRRSSVAEQLAYTQSVGGSNPSVSTAQMMCPLDE